MPHNERTVCKERLSSALQTIRKFISSFGGVALQFFEQDKSGGNPPVAPSVQSDKSKEAEQAKPQVVESAEGSKIEVKAATGIVTPEPSPEVKSTEQVVSSIETQQQEATPKQTIESTAGKSVYKRHQDDPSALQTRLKK